MNPEASPINQQREASNHERSVSVIIPTYLRPKQLTAAVRSVERHSAEVREVIVIDDADELHELSVGIPMRVLRQPHAGVSAARNRGIAEARGEFLYFLDDDDELQANALRSLLDGAQSSPVSDVFHGRWSTISTNGEVLRTPPTGPVESPLARVTARTLAPLSACLFRRSRVDSVGGFNTELAALEDWDLFLRLALDGATFHFVDRETALYVDSPGSLSKKWDIVLESGRRLQRGVLNHFAVTDPATAASLDRYLTIETARRARREGSVATAQRLIEQAGGDDGCTDLSVLSRQLLEEVERSFSKHLSITK